SLLEPDVVGVHVTGALGKGATATDVVLRVTELLRGTGVVGAFVEFHGEGCARLAAPHRATVANMAPEYGATVGFFPIDEETLRYYAATGRDADHVETIRRYLVEQGLFGMPRGGELDYTRTVELDLGEVKPSIAGPRRPQDRIELGRVRETFARLFSEPTPTGYGKPATDLATRHAIDAPG